MTETAKPLNKHADITGVLLQKAYSGGQWIDATSGERISVYNPSNGKIIGSVPSLDTTEMQNAIATANEALPDWRHMLPRRRADLLMRWHDLIVERRDSLAALMTLEQGKPLSDSQGEIEYGASFVRWFAEETNRVYGEIIPSHLPDRKMFVQREPLGVVGMITPWNFPSAMLARKAAAALAAGCTVIAVPSSHTPFSALALAALAEEAGLPAGVFSILTGKARILGAELCRNEVVRGISFTGSTEVGRLLMAQCAPTVKRMSLELGGHAPFIVFPDVDVKAAAMAAAAAKFQTGGQDCLAANRIFVHGSIYDAFVAAFAEAASAIKVGDGMDPETDMGPLIDQTAMAKAAEHVSDAIEHGARLVTGGRPCDRGGLFYEPTVLANVPASATIMHEETFGPVAAVVPFEEEAQVVASANDTEYGLVAYVFTNDLSRAHRVSDALEYGMVAVNTVKITGAPIPFGGIKQSGLGREGSRHGIDEYTVLKYLCMAVNPSK